MSSTYRVALSGDFRKADGSPTFPDFDTRPLFDAPGVEVVYLDMASPVRADQVADILDEQEATLGHLQVVQRMLHLLRFEMAGAAGFDLEDRNAGAGDALGVGRCGPGPGGGGLHQRARHLDPVQRQVRDLGHQAGLRRARPPGGGKFD